MKITVAREELVGAGYTEIVSQNSSGRVVLRNDCGGLEVFGVVDSCASFGIPTEQGRVLEFARSLFLVS